MDSLTGSTLESFQTLKSEFPELADEVILSALRDAGNQLDTARNAIQSKYYDSKEAFEAEGSIWNGFSNLFAGADAGLSIRDIQEGFNSLSASVSLGARSVVHTLSSILPEEINPFIEYIDDEEYEEEERLMQAARETKDEVVTRGSTAAGVQVKRRGATSVTPQPPISRTPATPEYDDEDEDDDEPNKWD